MSKRSHKRTRASEKRILLDRKLLIAITTAAAILVAGSLIFISARASAPPTASPTNVGIPVDGSSKGQRDAPVTVEEYADFQCPFCGQFALSTGRQLENLYVRTGQVRWVFRHYAFLGPESVWAAEASECASEQGQFWPYHDRLFGRQDGENRGAFTLSSLKQLAREQGLNAAGFDSCLDSHRNLQKVQRDTRDGQDKGVKSTPTFLINGRMIQGAQPLAVFQSVIQEELKKKR